MAEARRLLSVKAAEKAGQILDACPADLRGWEWGYLKRLVERRWNAPDNGAALTLSGHNDGVSALEFSPSGLLASADQRGVLKIWHLPGITPILSIPAHKSTIIGLSFHPGGKWLASASGDATIGIWDVASGRKIHTLTGHTEFVNSAEFSPDGKFVLSASNDRTIKIWDAASGNVVRTLSGHTDVVRRAVYRPDGNRLASYSDDGTIKIWDPHNGREVFAFATGSSWMRNLVYSPDGTRLAMAVDDNAFRIWDASTGRPLLMLRGHTDTARCVAFSPDGRRLATGSPDRTVRIWDAVSGRELLTLTGHADRVIRVAFSDDGRYLASGSADHTIKIWESIESGPVGNASKGEDAGSGSPASPTGSRIYDLVTMTANPGKLEALINRLREKIPLLDRHGFEVLGFWTHHGDMEQTEGKLLCLFAFPNLEAATNSWKALQDDPDDRALIARTDRDGIVLKEGLKTSMDLLDFSPIPRPVPVDAAAPRRVFQLRILDVASGRYDALYSRFRVPGDRLLKKCGMEPVGYWTTHQEGGGQPTQIIYMIAFPSIEAARESWSMFATDPEWKVALERSLQGGDPVTNTESFMLSAVDFSPIR